MKLPQPSTTKNSSSSRAPSLAARRHRLQHSDQRSFPHCLDADSNRDLNEPLNGATAGDASRPRPAPRNHARPATTGTSTSLNENCNFGISTVFSTIVNCGIGLSSHDGHLENQHELHAGKSTTLSTYCNRTNSGMSTTLSKSKQRRLARPAQPGQRPPCPHTALAGPQRRRQPVQELHPDCAREPTLRLAGRPRR